MQVAIDPKRFVGLNAVADAVEHLHSGRSIGKVCTFSTNSMDILGTSLQTLLLCFFFRCIINFEYEQNLIPGGGLHRSNFH